MFYNVTSWSKTKQIALKFVGYNANFIENKCWCRPIVARQDKQMILLGNDISLRRLKVVKKKEPKRR